MSAVVSVSRRPGHSFAKTPVAAVRLVAGYGVVGDGHAGITVQHLSRVRRDPSQPNLRQVHLLSEELLTELRRAGYDVAPGDLGENLTTTGLDLAALPQGTRLLAGTAAVELTGLRNPCAQIDRFRSGLLHEVLHRRPDGTLVRRAGVMAVVTAGGIVRPGDTITVELPAEPYQPLEPV